MSSIGAIRAPQLMEKQTQDVHGESWGSARDMGYIRKDHSRISVISSLSANDDDKADWYKMFVQTKGDLRMSVQTDAETDLELDPESETYFEDVVEYFSGAGLRIEFYQNQGGRMNVVASNDKENETAYANFEHLVRGTLDTQATGEYYVKVTTETGEPPKEDINYILQFQMGDSFKYDFATVESSLNLSEQDKAELAIEEALSGGSLYSEEVQGLLDNATTNSLIMQGQAAATLLEAGAASMTNILNANAAKANGSATIFTFTA